MKVSRVVNLQADWAHRHVVGSRFSDDFLFFSFHLSVLLSSKLTLFPGRLPLCDYKMARLISCTLPSYARASLAQEFLQKPKAWFSLAIIARMVRPLVGRW